WELDWLLELAPHSISFARMPQPGEPLELPQHPVFVLGTGSSELQSLRLLAVGAAGARFGIVHLSDEWERDDTQVYGTPGCVWVVRNYWRTFYFGVPPSLLVLPLGYK